MGVERGLNLRTTSCLSKLGLCRMTYVCLPTSCCSISYRYHMSDTSSLAMRVVRILTQYAYRSTDAAREAGDGSFRRLRVRFLSDFVLETVRMMCISGFDRSKCQPISVLCLHLHARTSTTGPDIHMFFFFAETTGHASILRRSLPPYSPPSICHLAARADNGSPIEYQRKTP